MPVVGAVFGEAVSPHLTAACNHLYLYLSFEFVFCVLDDLFKSENGMACLLSQACFSSVCWSFVCFAGYVYLVVCVCLLVMCFHVCVCVFSVCICLATVGTKYLSVCQSAAFVLMD